MNRVMPQLSQELGRSPTIHELAERLDATPEDVARGDGRCAGVLHRIARCPGRRRRAQPHGDGGRGRSLVRTRGTVESAIAPAIKDLPSASAACLYLRFFAGMTQSEIADDIGVSQMRVSRILSNTLELLWRLR